jgi:serine/threonine-protein kinase
VARLVIPVPADEQIDWTYPAVAVSPNGAHLVYVASRHGVYQLHVRSIDRLASTTLLGTVGAAAPFFSPDSQWVGFFAGGKLKKIRIGGGASEIVCDALSSYGGSWAPTDVIYFAPGSFSGLLQVPAAGGTPKPFTTLQGDEISHRSPQVLPGGQAVLFTARTGPGSDERQVQVQRVSGGERRVLARGDTGAYVPTGHLVYVQPATGTLMAVALDLTHLQVGAAPPVAVADGILPLAEAAHYTFSSTGVLAYLAGASNFADRTLVWVDRQGKTEPLPVPSRPYEVPRLSPDGTQLAFMTAGAKFEVWVHDLARGHASPLIAGGSSQFPIWTPDGKRLTYRATRAGTRNIAWRMADGTGTEQRLTTGAGVHLPGAWSPDGKVLLYMDGTVGDDILELRLTEHTTQPFVRTPFSEGAPAFSRDGRWVAYLSDVSGRYEVYIQPYPGPGGAIRISADGGTEPVWNPNGRELFYRSGNKMMVVETAATPVFATAKPRVLFTGNFALHYNSVPNYDISRDGRRFLMIGPSAHENATPTEITVVLNWFDELKRLAPTK